MMIPDLSSFAALHRDLVPFASDDRLIEVLGGGRIRARNDPALLPTEKFFDGYWQAALHDFIGAEEVTLAYTLRIDQSVVGAMREQGCKLPGFNNEWLDGRSVGGGFAYLEIDVGPWGPWDVLHWHGRYDAARGGFPLLHYPYLLCNPSYKGAPGNPAPPGKYSGSGNPWYWQFDTGAVLLPDVDNRLELTVRLNTVKNPTLKPQRTADQAGIDAALANGNRDGLIRTRLNGVTVYEATDVMFRGETGHVRAWDFNNNLVYDGPANFFVVWLLIFQGGHGTFPSAPSFYEISNVSITVGPQQQPQGDIPMATVQITDVKGQLNISLDDGDPDPIVTRGGKPVTPSGGADQSALVESLDTENAKLREVIAKLRTSAVARGATDDAVRDGAADVALIDALPPPVVVPGATPTK